MQLIDAVHLLIRLLLVAVLILQSSCTHLFFYPSRNQVINPGLLNINYTDLSIVSKDGTVLHGWWMYSDLTPRARILFFHGNGENISTHIGHVYWLLNYGYDVIAVDYRGYGASQGEPELEGSIQDIKASLAYMHEATASDDIPLLVLGQSMGGSLSIAALAESQVKENIAGLIVVGSFSDYHHITQDMLARFWLTWLFQWPLSFTVDNSYSPRDYIDRIAPVPVFIMHGQQDDVVPAYHATVLYEAAMSPKQIRLVDGDHNHIFHGQPNRRVLLDILDSLMEEKTLP